MNQIGLVSFNLAIQSCDCSVAVAEFYNGSVLEEKGGNSYSPFFRKEKKNVLYFDKADEMIFISFLQNC